MISCHEYLDLLGLLVIHQICSLISANEAPHNNCCNNWFRIALYKSSICTWRVTKWSSNIVTCIISHVWWLAALKRESLRMLYDIYQVCPLEILQNMIQTPSNLLCFLEGVLHGVTYKPFSWSGSFIVTKISETLLQIYCMLAHIS